MAVLIISLIYILFDILQEIKLRGYIGNVLGKISSKYEERKKNREVYLLLEGEREEISFLEKVDLLIERSGLKSYAPFITSEILCVITVITALVSAIICMKVLGSIVFSVPVFFTMILLVYLILKELSKITYDKIDDQVLIYINILENLTSTNSDIVEIMEKAIPFMKEPLKGFSKCFTFECKTGTTVEQAFRNFEKKIESKRFRQLLKNLEICSKYEANYKEILKKSRIIMKNYFTEKERRKKEVRQGRIAIVSIVFLGIVLFKLVLGINGDLISELKNTYIGNIIVAYNLFVLLFAVFKFITLDDINY